MEKRVLDYGKSMYGGWYANTLEDGHYGGVHAETLKGVKEELKLKGFSDDLRRVPRRDND